MEGSRILLISTGATPQVVTETLFALAHSDPPWWPQRLIIATTSAGARLLETGDTARAIAPLLGPDGRLARLARFAQRPLPAVVLRVPRHSDGAPIADIRTATEVERFAEQLLEVVAEATADPATELHVSLAGGRKSMSFITGQIMSLLGRPQDRLSHVLVEPAALEQQPDFWWPGDGSAGADRAAVGLHDVPYLRVRAWADIGARLPAGTGFTDSVAHANRLLGPLDLTIDLDRRLIEVAGTIIPATPQQLAAMALVGCARMHNRTLGVQTGWHPRHPKLRAIAIDGDRQQAADLWAWFYAAADFRTIYRDTIAVSFQPFDEQIDLRRRHLDYDNQIGSVVSRLRADFSRYLPLKSALRVLEKRNLATHVPSAHIRLVIPAALAKHPARPPGTGTPGDAGLSPRPAPIIG